MSQSLPTEKFSFTWKARRAFALFRREVFGIARDFWKDGPWDPSTFIDGVMLADEALANDIPLGKPEHIEHPGPAPSNELWHAAPGEISEKMWGKGCVTPADEYFTELLIKPLGLTKDMSLLDLAAGLGGRMRRTTQEFGIYVTGREPDPEIAARGMAMSIAAGRSKRDAITAYDPMNLIETRKYDCIVMCETLYRVADKGKFISRMVACCKPQAQISFTDYIVNPEAKDKPAILAWRAFEKTAEPVGLVEMAELWAKAGVNLRVHDDHTEHYKNDVKKGLVRLAQFLSSGEKPDEVTKKAIEKRIKTWAHRMAAIEQGMQFYRFYGQR